MISKLLDKWLPFSHDHRFALLPIYSRQWWRNYDLVAMCRKHKSISSQECKLAVIVPFRNREEHALHFVPYLHTYLTDRAIDHTIILVEQKDDGLPFNRGKLLNVGFSLANEECDYFCFHDIDMLPLDSYYTPFPYPLHLAAKATQFDVLPDQYFGGVTQFNRDDFVAVNGFSNQYWHWGAEDNDLLFRCRSSRLLAYRYLRGNFRSLPHPPSRYQTPQGWYEQESAKKTELDALVERNKEQFREMRKGRIDFRKDGLSSLEFSLVAEEVFPSFLHYIVDIKSDKL
ncbi:hypothetical protein JYU14_02010 [Simkania negevensis]|uniref:Beta-1,4-N-acetylgalactosaminyltransferase bre-4 n=1 Tax=Simkania negevensis TaxID=83561 RepID=A0ABS3ARU1_9BACT|nr:hypothetical protein [Simkania negevensis]